MKKLFLLMLATVMLLTAAPTALSEAETAELPPDLFDVLLYDGESPTWIANALQFSNGRGKGLPGVPAGCFRRRERLGGGDGGGGRIRPFHHDLL